MNRTAYRLFVAVLIFSPLAFGTVETWSLAVMEFLALLSLFVFFARTAKKENPSLHEIPGIIPLMLFLLFLIFQVVPLPALILRIIAPANHAAYRDISFNGEPVWVSLSIHRKATVVEFFRYAAYAATYILTVQLLSRKERIKKTIAVLLLLGVAVSFFGMLQHLVPNKKIYWFRELSLGGTPFGPFVNRNHYAGFMGMLFPLAFSLFLYFRPVLRQEPLRQKLVNFFSHPMTNIYAFLGFASLLMATSVFLSLSRGGIASMSMALALLGLLLNRKIRQSRMRLLFILSSVVILYAVGWFGWEPVFERFRAVRNVQGDISDLRLDLWKDSLAIIKDFSLLGAGFGSFLHVYPTYRTITSEGIADHAHNDYIELMTDGGLVGTLLFAWFIGAVIIRSYRTFQARRDPFSIHLFAGGLAGICGLMLHSFTDFNLHIGSNGLYFFFLLGLLVAASHVNMKEERVGTRLRSVTIPLTLSALIVCSLAFLSLAFNAGQMLSRLYVSEVQHAGPLSTSSEDIAVLRENLKRAVLLDPLEADYHYRLAGTEFLIDKEEALRQYRRSVRLNPVNAEHLQSLGMALSEGGRTEDAEKFLRLGVVRDRTNPVIYKRYASWLTMQERGEEGLPYFRKALLLEPGKTREYITSLVLLGYRDDDIGRIIPEQVDACLAFADYLAKTGKDAMAADIFMKVLVLASQEKNPGPSPFFRASDFFLSRGMKEDAVRALEKAVALMPDSVQARLRLAEALEKAGLKERARPEYERVLELDPGNTAVRKRLNDW